MDTTPLHAAAAVSSGRPVLDSSSLTELIPMVRATDDLVRARLVQPRVFWELACAVSLDAQGVNEISQLIQRKMFGSTKTSTDSLIADQLRSVLRWSQQQFPNLRNDLQLRQGPLKAQWEARGPGLLRGVINQTSDNIVPGSAAVALVHPIVGGDGAAHLDFNTIRIEAVVTDVTPELPEVVRMAWLICQLQVDLPMNSESLNKFQLPLIASLALLKPTLIAGKHVELISCDERALELAIQNWVQPAFLELGMETGRLATIVTDWWTTVQNNRPPWNVALAALDRMLDR